MNQQIKFIRAILYFLFDKGVDFDSAEVNSVFDSISEGWEHYWALDDDLSQKAFRDASRKVISILNDKQLLAEYFLTNSK